jgi:hypothetical protein
MARDIRSRPGSDVGLARPTTLWSRRSLPRAIPTACVCTKRFDFQLYGVGPCPRADSFRLLSD